MKRRGKVEMTSLCPICGKIFCGHTPEERGQTESEVKRPLSLEEYGAWLMSNIPYRIFVARKHIHDSSRA